MSKRPIIIEPDPILRKKSQSLENVDNDLRKLLDEKVKESMYGFGWVWVSVSFVLIFVLGYGMLTEQKDERNEEYINICKKKRQS